MSHWETSVSLGDQCLLKRPVSPQETSVSKGDLCFLGRQECVRHHSVGKWKYIYFRFPQAFVRETIIKLFGVLFSFKWGMGVMPRYKSLVHLWFYRRSIKTELTEHQPLPLESPSYLQPVYQSKLISHLQIKLE